MFFLVIFYAENVLSSYALMQSLIMVKEWHILMRFWWVWKLWPASLCTHMWLILLYWFLTCVHAGVCKFDFWVVLQVTSSVVTTTTCCCLSHGHVSNLLYVNVIIFALFKLVFFCVPFTFARELYHKKNTAFYLVSLFQRKYLSTCHKNIHVKYKSLWPCKNCAVLLIRKCQHWHVYPDLVENLFW